MTVLLQIIAHMLVACFVAVLGYITVRLATSSYKIEAYVRVLAILAGVLVYLGGKAAGLSVVRLAALATNDSLLSRLLGILLPLVVGSFLGYMVARAPQESSGPSRRLALMVLTFAFVSAMDLWFWGIRQEPIPEAKAALMPLISLVIGFSQFLILRFRPSEKSPRPDGDAEPRPSTDGLRRR